MIGDTCCETPILAGLVHRVSVRASQGTAYRVAVIHGASILASLSDINFPATDFFLSLHRPTKATSGTETDKNSRGLPRQRGEHLPPRFPFYGWHVDRVKIMSTLAAGLFMQTCGLGVLRSSDIAAGTSHDWGEAQLPSEACRMDDDAQSAVGHTLAHTLTSTSRPGNRKKDNETRGPNVAN